MNLGDPDAYLGVFQAAVEFAVFPGAQCYVHSGAMDVKTRRDFRQQEHLKDLQWKRASRVGDIGFISSKIFREMGMRQFPLCVQPQMACASFGLWNTVCARLMDYNK